VAHRGGDGSSGRKRPNALTPQNKATASFRFLQQAYFGLRFGLRKLGGERQGLPRVAVYEPDLRLGYGFRQVDGFDYAGG
jgi:hypothetical protein